MGPKIATCSYCGTRAALVFDRGRHELNLFGLRCAVARHEGDAAIACEDSEKSRHERAGSAPAAAQGP